MLIFVFKMCSEFVCAVCCHSRFIMCIYRDLRFQQSESVPAISYRVDSEASRAAGHEHDTELGGRRGEGSDALVMGGREEGRWGGQLVLLHIRFCLFFISGFHKNLTVINRQQVALFLFFV